MGHVAGTSSHVSKPTLCLCETSRSTEHPITSHQQQRYAIPALSSEIAGTPRSISHSINASTARRPSAPSACALPDRRLSRASRTIIKSPRPHRCIAVSCQSISLVQKVRDIRTRATSRPCCQHLFQSPLIQRASMVPEISNRGEDCSCIFTTTHAMSPWSD